MPGFAKAWNFMNRYVKEKIGLDLDWMELDGDSVSVVRSHRIEPIVAQKKTTEMPSQISPDEIVPLSKANPRERVIPATSNNNITTRSKKKLKSHPRKSNQRARQRLTNSVKMQLFSVELLEAHRETPQLCVQIIIFHRRNSVKMQCFCQLAVVVKLRFSVELLEVHRKIPHLNTQMKIFHRKLIR